MSVNNAGLSTPLRLKIIADDLKRRKSFNLLQDITVRRFDMNKQGEIKGVYYSKISGEDGYINTEIVILCAGAIQNARLLLLSENTYATQGIGNGSGHVGCNFMDHPNIQYWVEPNDELLSNNDRSTFVHSYHFYDLMKSQGLSSALLRFGLYSKNWQNRFNYKNLPESNGLATPEQRLMIEALCEQEPQSSNYISLDKAANDQFRDKLAHLVFSQSNQDIKTIKYITKQLITLSQVLGNNYTVRPLRLSSHHLMGTTRMSALESDGVVDKNLKVYGTKNLYISGASVFPTGGAANPTLTLTALSLRLADHILSKYK